MLFILFFSVVAYCIGSISSAILVCRLANLPDPRTQGSHNPGTTNVLRLGGRRLALYTLLGDTLKGYVPVVLIMMITHNPYSIGVVCCATLLGHLYPIFFNFRGGKGVATFMGILFALKFVLGFLFLMIWLLVLGLFRISALSALIACLLSPILALYILNFEYAFFVAIMAGLIIWRHQDNMKRLWKGTEPKVGHKDTF